MRKSASLSLFLVSLACAGCSSGGSGGSATDTASGPAPDNCTTAVGSTANAVFAQTSKSLGLCYAVDERFAAVDMHMMGGGLAMSDVDGDGRLDMYVVHGAYDTGALYRFDGAAFIAVSGNAGIEPRGLDNAGYFVDIDGDGFDDFISILYEPNFVQVFSNDGTGNFSDVTASTNIYIDKPTYSLAAADYDLDGDLDLFFAHWGWAWQGAPTMQYLWRNDGSGVFTDVSDIVEIVPSFRPPPFDDVLTEHSFTPIFTDINDDGFPDLLLAGDFESSQVLINDAGQAFVDVTTDVISDENGMGADIADYDGDGDMDWFVSSIYYGGKEKQYQGGVTGNRLYRNDGNGVFADVTDEAGVRDGAWGWGACFADFDNDGHVDIFHTNGMRSASSRDGDTSHALYDFFRDRSRLFMSRGDGTFAEQGESAGIDHVAQGRGAVCTDYDGDGRVDILIANNGDSPTIYRNRMGGGNHYLAVDLEGPPRNRRGIGARVSVETPSGTQVRDVVLGSNYLSQAPATLYFGLGPHAEATAVVVRWPAAIGGETRLENVSADQRLVIALD